jgi:hypothetical protein
MVCCAPIRRYITVMYDEANLRNDADAHCDDQHVSDLYQSLASRSCGFCRFSKRNAKSSRANARRSGRRKTKSAAHSESVRGGCEKAVSGHQTWWRAHPPVFARPGIESHSCLPPSLGASFLESLASHLNKSFLLTRSITGPTVIFDSSNLA